MRRKNKVPALLTQHHPRSALSEAYRTLRTNLSFASVDRKCRLMMVTGALPNDGKTVVAANLAIVLAQAGERVLLVDCDLRKPSVHQVFNLNNLCGLTNLLIQEEGYDPNEMIQQGPVDGLSILTAGPQPPNPSELLGTERMRGLWPQLLEKFDYVIVDSPPVLAVTDAVILSTQVEGVVLVVWAGVERVDDINQAKEQLQKAKANLLGVVLNKVKKPVRDDYYYYYEEKEKA